jgi:hypothetical protein
MISPLALSIYNFIQFWFAMAMEFPDASRGYRNYREMDSFHVMIETYQFVSNFPSTVKPALPDPCPQRVIFWSRELGHEGGNCKTQKLSNTQAETKNILQEITLISILKAF